MMIFILVTKISATVQKSSHIRHDYLIFLFASRSFSSITEKTDLLAPIPDLMKESCSAKKGKNWMIQKKCIIFAVDFLLIWIDA